MRVGRVIYTHLCGSSLVEAVNAEINATQGLSHTRWSSPHSLVTHVQSQSVKHNHSGVTANCSVQCTVSSTASCSVGFTRHNMDDVRIKNNLQVM